MNHPGHRTGGQVLIDQLLIHGARLAFCVPGESYLAALDALYDAGNRIRLVTCRHEANAANMAEAHGKLTGKPGICFVTRGPGASHAYVGVHTALQDSTPMILFVGQVARETVGREAFQEIDIKAMFGDTAKWAVDVRDAERLPELVARAFQTATSGRPGPVVIGLHEDMLTDRVAVADAQPYRAVRPSPSTAALAELRERIAAARRPLVMAGGGGWSRQAADDLAAFAAAFDLPVCCSFRAQDIMDHRYPHYVGDSSLSISPTLLDALKQADLLLVVGARLGEITSQSYEVVAPPVPSQTLVHVHPGIGELGRVYQAALYINAGMPEFCAAARALAPLQNPPYAEWTHRLRAGYVDYLKPSPMPGAVDLASCMETMQALLPDDVLVATDAGNFAGWVNCFWRFKGYRSLLGPTNGAMGYGLPAAIAAKLAQPERTVVNISGDGGFMMAANDLGTAVQAGANIVAVIVNNGLYGTIRMHQEREYPERIVATNLHNPDFAAYARAFGAHGETVDRTEDFAPAFKRALAAGKPALIDLRIDPEAITPRTTLAAIRETALKRIAAETSNNR
jgi:acetolactate synthase-1/2/3 large subunit